MPTKGNQLLASLASDDRAVIASRLERVDLELGAVLEAPGEPISHVYFPISGLISSTAAIGGRPRAELGMTGREGMTGAMVVLGADRSPHLTMVQGSGAALRITTGGLTRALAVSPQLTRCCLHSIQATLLQTGYTALANATMGIEDRLCRWLLMAQDRMGGTELTLTHRFLAIMLAVRRPGVTLALHALEGRGLVRSQRNQIVIVDRKGLELRAGASYGVPEAVLAQNLHR